MVKPLPSDLTDQCVPRYLYPADDITVESLVDRIIALELSRACDANKFELIKAAQK